MRSIRSEACGRSEGLRPLGVLRTRGGLRPGMAAWVACGQQGLLRKHGWPGASRGIQLKIENLKLKTLDKKFN